MRKKRVPTVREGRIARLRPSGKGWRKLKTAVHHQVADNWSAHVSFSGKSLFVLNMGDLLLLALFESVRG